MTLILQKEKLQHLNSITHESKVLVLATDTDGKIWYSVKQDGFEDSYLNTAAEQRTGWENWQQLEFPDEKVDDQSVIEKETASLTHQKDTSKYILKSRYRTKEESSVAPVQMVSALGHIYVFRQSKSNTLLVDRFVLDGMTNKLNRKLEVRFKRSKQKHKATKNMNKGTNGLVNIDSLDFRDANGNFFYEPTIELCSVSNLQKGWFSVVLVPTIENDVYRWHIFAHNSQTQKVELTTIRASEEGLFDVKDYTIFDLVNNKLVPRSIAGVIKRTLDINGVSVTNGLSATKYDLQQEQQTQSGEMQLIKTATRLMLAIPTDKGTAAFSFAIGGDGTLAQIDETAENTILRSTQREILLPLNTLDEIKAIADRTPPPQGIITGLVEGTNEEDAEDLVKISTQGAAGLENYDLVKISGTSDYQGLYRAKTVDKNTFEIDLPSVNGNGLGYWEKEDREAGGFIFDGMITAYKKTADGKLRVICPDHGLENGDEVQIAGTDVYNNTYPVRKIDDTQFVIERKWATGEAINVKLVSRKRRGVVFDGVDDSIKINHSNTFNVDAITLECWFQWTEQNGKTVAFLCGKGTEELEIHLGGGGGEQGIRFIPVSGVYIDTGSGKFKSGEWVHVAAVYDPKQSLGKVYINGKDTQAVSSGSRPLTTAISKSSTDLFLGMRSNNSYYFQGKIAEVRVWKVARTAEEIKNSMYLQQTGKEVGLVGYWRLGAIAEGKVIDFSANANDGTVYGDAYVSAATLNRKLAGGNDAVKYSNSDLFAVSERATYEESFEFKVNSSTAVNLAYLDNADGKGIGNKIFTLLYWGKTSRSAEDKKPISAVQNQFEDLGRGWYRASSNVTIPDGVSMLRSFEIANVNGNWVSLEIRKHRIRLLSDSITEAKYTDSVTLRTLADEQASLATKLQQLERKEQEEAALILEKWKLEQQLNALANLPQTEIRVNQLKTEIIQLEGEQKKHQAEIDNLFNYWCVIRNVGNNNYLQTSGGIVIAIQTTTSEATWKSVGWHNAHWRIDKVEGNFYRLQNRLNELVLIITDSGVVQTVFNWQTTQVLPAHILILSQWLLEKMGDAYRIQNKLTRAELLPLGGLVLCIHPYVFGAQQQWQIVSTGQAANQALIDSAKSSLGTILTTLKAKREELQRLEEVLREGRTKEAIWRKRLAEVIAQLTQVQTTFNTLNTDFINGVKNTQQMPQAMPQVAKDGKGLVTQGALLSFVNSASRLNAIETCEGNVQLSYFDTQGRMRQTNYDAAADSKNTAFEQWIPDAQRACLNFNKSNSVVKLNQPLPLPSDWSIEAWFVYPLPDAGQWNTLTRAQSAGHHILVRNRKQLGTYLDTELMGQSFYDSGFNMELLPPGWHHIAAVGRGDTTLFYIDGKKVGDTKAKAIADAEENFKKTPNDAAAKTKVEDIKKATVKVTRDVYAIGNFQGGTQQFGKVAEVRIWGVALSDSEIAVNSKTLLSGNEPGLLAYYPLNEATGETVRDQTGNGNNGTVEGAIWWGCSAPIGNPGNTVMKFDGVNDYVDVPYSASLNPSQFTISFWVKAEGGQGTRRSPLASRSETSGLKGYFFYATPEDTWAVIVGSGSGWQGINGINVILNTWTHLTATHDGSALKFYINGTLAGTVQTSYTVNSDCPLRFGTGTPGGNPQFFFPGQIAEVCIWKTARTQAEIQVDMCKRLSRKEPNLVAYYPLNEIKPEGSTRKVLDLAGNNHGIVTEAITVDSNTLPIGGDALVSNEYSTVTLENTRKIAIMRRFFASPATNGATLLPDKRIEALQLKWIGNAQFAPTLLGYIEGPPPVPTENLTVEDDYNGATSVELTMSEDVAFSWNRSQDAGLGASIDTFIGGGGTMSILTAPMGMGTSIETSTKVGVKGNFDFSYQFQNNSSITSSSSLSMTDKLELRGTPEQTAKFPHLGKRFIPKNIGYALVVSALADVFVTRLARSGKMVGYQVQPVDGIPPDVNTITFLMNPAYTMNGSLDGLTGSSATSDRFFKHVPEMRSQYGSLYPASYYRLQEAYDLKRQIEAEDKRRESYFSNFDVRLLHEDSLNRNIDSGDAPTTMGVQRQEDKPSTQMTNEEKQKAQDEKAQQFQADSAAASGKTNAATKAKQAEIKKQISDREKRVQANNGFEGWQKRMEDIQIRAGKRNIVNTYVWDADGGLRTEAQSFANTVEHTIGGSFSMNAGLGVGSSFALGIVAVELTAQATVNLTLTMSKTEARSQGFQLNVDLGGLEHKGITDYKDNPILPGEKVDRYRFMSFYLEGSTNHFQDFFNYVVDPEWLRSNDEEARALRQAQAGKPNKAWRVLHRVTYVERPALMGFGRDVRKLRATAATSDHNQLLAKIARLEDSNRKLEKKLDQILNQLQPKK